MIRNYNANWIRTDYRPNALLNEHSLSLSPIQFIGTNEEISVQKTEREKERKRERGSFLKL